MKKLFTIFGAILLSAGMLLPQQAGAQPLDYMSYQAVIRNSNNQLVVNKQIAMRISLQRKNAGYPIT